MTEFQLIGGEVAGVRHGIDAAAPPVRQLTHFTLQSCTVAYSDLQPMFVREGDLVWVAGAWDDSGVFRAAAYRNFSSGVEGCRDTRAETFALAVPLAVCSLLALAAGAAFVWMPSGDLAELRHFVAEHPSAWLLGVPAAALPACLAGLWVRVVRRAGEPQRALRALRAASPSS